MFICYYSLKLLRVYESKNHSFFDINGYLLTCQTRGSAMAEGLRDALVSRNSANTKHPI